MKSFEVVRKPESISWDVVHEVLWKSHASNRKKGIVMSVPSLSGDKLKEKIEDGHGCVFVAMIDGQVIGTAAFTLLSSKKWFCEGEYVYYCLDGVLPEYRGQGVYRELFSHRESMRQELGYTLAVLETHEKNHAVIGMHEKNGFKRVLYKKCHDHNNVVMAKWDSGSCTYSNVYIKCRYYFSYLKIKTKAIIRKLKFK